MALDIVHTNSKIRVSQQTHTLVDNTFTIQVIEVGPNSVYVWIGNNACLHNLCTAISTPNVRVPFSLSQAQLC